MITTKSITAFVLTRRGSYALFTTTFAMWLCVLSSFDGAQAGNSRTNQPENAMTQFQATQRVGRR